MLGLQYHCLMCICESYLLRDVLGLRYHCLMCTCESCLLGDVLDLMCICESCLLRDDGHNTFNVKWRWPQYITIDVN